MTKAEEIDELLKVPPQVGYTMSMWTEMNGDIDRNDVTREEYIALTRRLAEIRGLAVPVAGRDDNEDLIADAKREIKTAAMRALPARVRASVAEELRFYFDIFLRDGTPEEHRFLLEVLTMSSSNSHGRDELRIAEEFLMAIGNSKNPTQQGGANA